MYLYPESLRCLYDEVVGDVVAAAVTAVVDAAAAHHAAAVTAAIARHPDR